MTKSGTNPIIAATLAKAGGVSSLTVYLYFDGVDADAYTAKAVDLSAITVGLTFKID